MEKHNELIAAILLNAYSTDRLYYAIKNEPEPEAEKEITSLIDAWKHLVTCLDAETN